MAFGPTSRIVGIDDGPFEPTARARVLLVGVLMRGGGRVDGVMTAQVVRDGLRATRSVVSMLTEGRLAGQAQAVLLDGLAVGGFNVLDLPRLAHVLRVPAIAVMRKAPNLEALRVAVGRTTHSARRWELIQAAGPIHSHGRLFFQVAGASPGTARQILTHTTPDGRYPEALRVAHLIAGGVVRGVSRGRA